MFPHPLRLEGGAVFYIYCIFRNDAMEDAYTHTGDAEMKREKWKTYLFWIALSEAVGALSGLLSMSGMREYRAQVSQPGFAPPPAIFPIVWAILFALMGFGMARIRLEGNSKRAQNLFIAQLVVNFFWPLIFFNAQAYGFALVWLLLLLALAASMALEFYRHDKLAGLLQLPYLGWLIFAAILTGAVRALN